MDKFSHILERLSLSILLIGGAGMLTSMFLGAGDVVGTQFFGWPIPGAKEITESTMVLIVFGALAYAQLRKSHIRVELVYTHMPARARAVMDVVADAAAIGFFSLLLWQCTIEAMLSWRIGEAADGLIRFPLYPARWILVAGTALLIIQLVLDLSRDLRRAGGDDSIPEPVQEAFVPELRGLNGDNE